MNKKKISIILILICSATLSYGQGGVWTWMKGSAAHSSNGNYGVKGVSSPNNNPPARYQGTYWKDKDGNFWLFGGKKGATYYNDLWKYDISTNEWTWINGPQLSNNTVGNYGIMGIPSPLNLPHARSYGCFKWIDPLGNLYIYGGTYGSDKFNDIWRYEISSNEWTWVAGTNTVNDPPVYGIQGVPSPTNTPGSRVEGTSSWEIGYDFYIFGGVAHDQPSGTKNDLWKLNVNTLQWTWIAGETTLNPPGVYGTLGISSQNTVPSGRLSNTSWRDKDSLFIFGGQSQGQNTSLNDLWKFDLHNKKWTWLSGDSTINSDGFVQAVCQDNPNNSPSSRMENRTLNSLNKCTQKMITFGGFHQLFEVLNDLWTYDNHTRSWKLIWGNTNGTPIPYDYGIKGVTANTNAIPPRGGPCIWNDDENNIWIFGGTTLTTGWGTHNDLWKFTPDTSCLKANIVSSEINFNISDTNICKNESVNILFPSGANVQINPMANVVYDSLNHSATFSPNTKQVYTIRLTDNASHPCPFDTTLSFTINIFTPAIEGLNDTNICQGDSYDLNFLPESDIQITPAGSFTYDQNNHSASFNPISKQTYSINLKSNALAQCSFDTTIIFNLDVIQHPISNFEANLICDDNARIVTKNNSTNATSYSWYLYGELYSNDQQPKAKIIEEINQEDLCVSLSVSNSCFTDSSTYCIPSESQFVVPNAFSPNGDGRNDIFKIQAIGSQNLDIEYFSVFNRWGQRIFHTNDWRKGWNGNYKGVPAEIGTYFFIIKVNEGSCTKGVKSDVTLIR